MDKSTLSVWVPFRGKTALAVVVFVFVLLFSSCKLIGDMIGENSENSVPEGPEGGGSGEEVPIEFISASADGEVLTATTTQLTLTFNSAVSGLSADDITINHRGTGATVAGTSTQNGSVWTLGISGITAPGNISVSVNKQGYVISGNPQTVMVRRARPNVYAPELVYVQGGTFTMGGTGNGPEHTVTLSDFYISNHEVTEAEWQGTGSSSLPVERVSWFQAVQYCNQLSTKEGLVPAYNISGNTVTLIPGATGYRLPTEAEWEYAARGGNQSQNFTYSGSNTRGEVSWHGGVGRRSVGTKLANELGLFDMSGNIREWCWDWWGSYSSSPQTNPTGPSSSTDDDYLAGFLIPSSTRVLRGGGYVLDNTSASTDYPFYRDHWSPWAVSIGVSTIGFRVARSVVSGD
jgi:formylglycine-generating enzyme required for sulfatase activity